MNCSSYTSFFATISKPIRLKIIYLLKERPMNVSEICTHLNEEQSKVSHNLRCLARCQLIYSYADGRNRIYSVNKDIITPLTALVEKHISKCCKKCTVQVPR